MSRIRPVPLDAQSDVLLAANEMRFQQDDDEDEEEDDDEKRDRDDSEDEDEEDSGYSV